MKIAIVSSRDIIPGSSGYQEACHLIEVVVSYWEATEYAVEILSGGAVGIDSLVRAYCICCPASEIDFREIKPDIPQWESTEGKVGFKERNIYIAEECEVLYAIIAKKSKSYGSGWTADYAESIGREVYR